MVPIIRALSATGTSFSLCIGCGSDSVQKFEESCRLRSHVVPVQAIYLRCRLVVIIDEPFRTRAISQLRLILDFRKGHYPPTNIPLRLPSPADRCTRNETYDDPFGVPQF